MTPDLVRRLALARQRGEGGIQELLGVFFKPEMTPAGKREEHAFAVQERALSDWLAASGVGTGTSIHVLQATLMSEDREETSRILKILLSHPARETEDAPLVGLAYVKAMG